MAPRGLKFKVKMMGEANAVGLTSIEGSLFSSSWLESVQLLVRRQEERVSCEEVLISGPGPGPIWHNSRKETKN